MVELVDVLVELCGHPGHLRLRQRVDPEGLDELVHPASGNPGEVAVGDHGDQRGLGAFAALERKLTGLEGPGDFFLYQQGWDGDPMLRFNTADGVDVADVFTVPERTHAHGTWAFTAEGVYCLAFERSATIDGAVQTDAFTLAVAVGETDPTKVNPGNCEGSEPVVTVPQAPAAPIAAVDGGNVTVRWVAPADGGSAITGYTVQLLGGSAPLVQDVTAGTTEVVFTGVPAGSYRAAVIAVNQVGASETSPVSEQVTVAAAPVDPTDPEPTDPEPTVPEPTDPGDLAPTGPDTEVSPVPDAELTDAARGGVDVPEAATPGSQIVVRVGLAHASERVRVWLHSTPVLLGTVTLDAQGRTTVTIPTGTVLGEHHRVVVQALDGKLIGWDGIKIGTASQVGPNGEWLAHTGADAGILFPLTAGGAILLLLGAVILVGTAKRRRERAAVEMS